MTTPRPNEGIDVEKEAESISTHWFNPSEPSFVFMVKEIVSLCARVRAETETAVTKRERDRCAKIAIESCNEYNDQSCFTAKIIHDKILAAYESNDAGGKKI